MAKFTALATKHTWNGVNILIIYNINLFHLHILDSRRRFYPAPEGAGCAQLTSNQAAWRRFEERGAMMSCVMYWQRWCRRCCDGYGPSRWCRCQHCCACCCDDDLYECCHRAAFPAFPAFPACACGWWRLLSVARVRWRG